MGRNDLIKYRKVHLLTSAAGLVSLLRWGIEAEKREKRCKKQLLVELDGTERSIYSYLRLNGKELLGTVALESNLPIFKVWSTSLKMGIKGVVRPLPGKLFEVVD